MRSSFNQTVLLSVLQSCRELVARSDDSDRSKMGVKEIHERLDHAIQQLQGSLPVEINDLRFLFAPTGSLQETALGNGWAEEFLVLANRFDRIIEAS